ncbi:MAG TPA: tetratricopeptide repeat protein [Bryobacteraceae bacterium]|nr:tetratricopeptide repeat protein [Bryobacteraceae bacterium]
MSKQPPAPSSGPAFETTRPAPNRFLIVGIGLGLFLTTLLVYAPVFRFGFVNFDDPDYVTNNPHVRNGLTMDGIVWAVTSAEAANWFPATRLSHLLDVEIFDMRPGGHHFTNAFLHACATVFLFAFLLAATGAAWPSAFVAILFAVHPLHVESVAWIAERKDVLSAFFWFLALWSYVRRHYWLTLLAFCMGLMSKPMVVTLPFVLFLLDKWPLRQSLRSALRVKIPLLVLSAASAVAAYLVQRSSGAVREVGQFPLGLRVENAVVSYAAYIVKMFWPARLAAFYPYPHHLPLWQIALSTLLLSGISIVVLRERRSRPYLAVGWLWYLGTLVPVIGLIQVGAQARADRYTYLPMVGLSIMLAWGLREVLKSKGAISGAIAACLACAVLCEAQIQYWRNSETLFRHALDVTSSNYLAHHNLGVALADEGRFAEAIKQYQAALQIEPNAANVQTDYGNALAKSGRMPEAIAHYQQALRALPDSPITHNDLANALAANPGSMPQAIAEYQTALRLKPDYEEARNNLAQVQSNAAEMQYNMGVDLARSGKPEAAIPHFEEALRLKRDYVDAHNNLGVVLAGTGRVQEAISHFEAALKIDPNSAEAHVNLGIALSGVPGRVPEAIQHFKAALRIKPDPEIQQMLDRLEKPR